MFFYLKLKEKNLPGDESNSEVCFISLAASTSLLAAIIFASASLFCLTTAESDSLSIFMSIKNIHME